MSSIQNETWPATRELWRRALGSSLAVVVATINPDGSPNVAPIGSLTLGPAPGTATYLELFATGTSANLDRDPRVTVLALDTSRFRFLRALWRGSFDAPIATRLSGTAGPRRPANAEEIARFRRRVHLLRRLRGYGPLWGFDRCHARDLTFELEQPVRLGRMTRHLTRTG